MVAGAAHVSGIGLASALLLGGAVAMSSTAIALKQLADQADISSQHGRLAVGILIFQDLAVLPFLVIVGAWDQSGGTAPFEVLRQLMIAGLAFGGAALVCRPVFRVATDACCRSIWARCSRAPKGRFRSILRVVSPKSIRADAADPRRQTGARSRATPAATHIGADRKPMRPEWRSRPSQSSILHPEGPKPRHCPGLEVKP